MLKHIHFQTVGVTDLERALGFYRDKLGLRVERDDPYGDSRWIFLALPEGKTLLHLEQRERVEQAAKPVLVFVTDDVDTTCEALKRQDVSIEQGPADAPWEPGTRWAMLRDSEGNMILIQTVKG